MYQHPLFDTSDIFDKPLRRYELFFSILDFSLLEKGTSIGRKPVSRAAILRALIFKNLHSIASLSDLSAELYERPAFASILGFELRVIKGKYLSVDSCPIKANVKENNLKASIRSRFIKCKLPKGDPDCRIGVFPIFVSGKVKVEFF